jgi:hypothetical protein
MAVPSTACKATPAVIVNLNTAVLKSATSHASQEAVIRGQPQLRKAALPLPWLLHADASRRYSFPS